MMKKRILYGLLILSIVIQFIKPTRNISNEPTPNEISLHYPVSEEVHGLLKHSCYDCHSNNTVYPWYANIQPIGWWMQHHVNEAKGELNFSEFGSYPVKKAKHKFKKIEEEVNEGAMPIRSYTLIHRDTKLTPEESRAVAAWAVGLK